MKTLLFVAWLTSCSADAASTHYALAHGAHELILTQNPYVDDAFLVGMGVAAGRAMSRPQFYRDHRKVAIVLTVVGVSIHTWATIHNIRTMEHLHP